jgi:hypothetical protein
LLKDALGDVTAQSRRHEIVGEVAPYPVGGEDEDIATSDTSGLGGQTRERVSDNPGVQEQ